MIQSSMFEPPQVWTGAEAEARAQQLGVPSREILGLALDFGEAGARTATADHPSSYAGYRMWGDGHAELARQLRPFGWVSEEKQSIPCCLLRERAIAIIVCAGDLYTGTAGHGHVPELRYSKGDLTTLLLNGAIDDLWSTSTDGGTYSIWLLLHFLKRGGGYTAELSRTQHLNTSGRVVAWSERILLPDGDGGRGDTIRAVPTRPVHPEITIPVTRRAS